MAIISPATSFELIQRISSVQIESTKTRSEKEDEAAAELVKPAPRIKPPRRDLENRNLSDDEEDPDMVADKKDRSRNYKSASDLLLRMLTAKITPTPAGRFRAERGKDDVEYFDTKDQAKTWLSGEDPESGEKPPKEKKPKETSPKKEKTDSDLAKDRIKKQVEDPLFDPESPFPESSSTKGTLKDSEKAIDRGVAAIKKYSSPEFSKVREAHLDKIEEEMKNLQDGDPRKMHLDAVRRGIGIASALTDGDKAQGIGSSLARLALASKESGNLRDLVSVGGLGGTKPLQSDDQALIRKMYKDLPDTSWDSVLPDDHPGKALSELLSDPDMGKHLNEDDRERIREHLTDLMAAETSFIDPHVTNELGAKSSVSERASSAKALRAQAVPKREMPSVKDKKGLKSWISEMVQSLVKGSAPKQKSEDPKPQTRRPGEVWIESGKFWSKSPDGETVRFESRDSAAEHAKGISKSSSTWDFTPW